MIEHILTIFIAHLKSQLDRYKKDANFDMAQRTAIQLRDLKEVLQKLVSQID